MKPGFADIKLPVQIEGEELLELKRHTWAMAEAFGLDSRIERYQGKKPIGLYRWDLDCLIDVISFVLNDAKAYPSQSAPGYLALRRLQERLQDTYRQAFP